MGRPSCHDAAVSLIEGPGSAILLIDLDRSRTPVAGVTQQTTTPTLAVGPRIYEQGFQPVVLDESEAQDGALRLDDLDGVACGQELGDLRLEEINLGCGQEAVGRFDGAAPQAEQHRAV